MRIVTAPLRTAASLSGASVALWLASAPDGFGFPVFDPSNLGAVPAGVELAPTEQQDLRNQLQLANGLIAGAGAGWTILPRLEFQEMFTDNALQLHSPRESDLVSIFSPGIAIAGNTSRIKLNLDYSPSLAMYARTSSQNSLTQQLSATGLGTAIEDWAFVDVRAVSGVQSRTGGIGGLGASNGNGLANIGTGNDGLGRNNLIQTTSFGVSPYLLHQFGDIGTGKIGYSANISRYNALNGFTASPIGDSGSNVQSMISQEEIAQFTSGEILPFVQDVVDVHLSQSTFNYGQATFATGTGTVGTGTGGGSVTSQSRRASISNKVTYPIDHQFSVFASLGYEDINYTGAFTSSIHGLTWGVGTTWTPDPDSKITVSYGRHDGANAFSADGIYSITARTVVGLTYSNSIGTRLENLQAGLNTSQFNAQGGLVNGRTGGNPFAAGNATGVDPGIYRFSTLNMNLRTLLDRDIITANVVWTKQTAEGGGTPASNSVDAKALIVQWTHQLTEDLTFNTAASYTLQNTSGGFNGGNTTVISASAALQYAVSDTLSATLRYSYFDRTTATTILAISQNLVILGLTKHF